jgi:hypothetical protein
MASSRGSSNKTDPEYINALHTQARAISELAHAIRTHSAALSLAPMEAKQQQPFAALSVAKALALALPPLSHPAILHEIGGCFGKPNIKDTTPLSDLVVGGPGAIAAMWKPLCTWPPFQQRGLNLSPNDLLHITMAGQLANIIDYLLNHHR